MKAFLVTPLLLSLASAAALLQRDEPVSYDGYKVFRIATGDNLESIEAQLSNFTLQAWNLDFSKHMDVAVSPDQLAAFSALSLDTSVMHEDLGAAIKDESSGTSTSSLTARALPSSSYFNTYHSYAEHLQFLRDLQSAFTSNSEIITSGTTVQGRTITGIHLWGGLTSFLVSANANSV